MYCTKCGKKLKEDANYCTNCGQSVNRNINTNNNTSTNTINSKPNFLTISLILGIISIFSIIIFNIFTIPIAITGLIFGLKSSKKLNPGVILNAIAIIITIILITFLVLLIVNIPNYIEEENDNIITNPYTDDIEGNDINYQLLGKWYLYEDGNIYQENYFLFNKDNTYTWAWEDNSYIGSYYVEYGITNPDGTKQYQDSSGYTYYNVTLVPSSIRNSEGIVENSNLIAQVFQIAIKDEDMKVTTQSSNDTFNLKKEILEVY